MVKFFRATRKLRAERVGAGGGSCSEKLGPGSEIVCTVCVDIRLMDRVDAIEGAGVGYSVNLRVSLYDHSEGTASFSFFGDARLNATDKHVISRGRRSKGSGLTQDDHCANRERNEIYQQIGWLGGGGYG